MKKAWNPMPEQRESLTLMHIFNPLKEEETFVSPEWGYNKILHNLAFNELFFIFKVR